MIRNAIETRGAVTGRILLRNLTIVAFAILLPSLLPAQNPRGSLRGTVQDPTGARIPQAKIVISTSPDRGTRTSFRRTLRKH